MNKQQAENLRALIRHMESKCERTLQMNAVSCCGTPACAMGELPAVAAFSAHRFTLADTRVGELLRDGKPALISHLSGEFFGLGGSVWDPSNNHFRLFGARPGNAWGRNNVTPQEWAAEARLVLAEHGYSMDEPRPAMTFKAFMVKVLEPRPELQGLPLER